MLDRRFVELLGNARTVGLTAFLLSIPIGIVAALTATHDAFASLEELLAWLAIGVLGQLAMGAALLVGNLVLVRRDFGKQGTRVATIVVAVGGGAARGIAIALLPAIWNLSTVTSIPVRIVSSAIIFGLWLVMIGAALGANDRYRAELDALVDELALHELQLRAADAEQSTLQRSRAAARIAESTEPIASVLEAAGGSVDHARTARLVQNAIEERLRPLSHQFWFDRAPVIETPRSATEFAGRVLSTPIPWRRALPLMTALLVVNSVVRWGLPTGFAAGVVGSTSVALIVLTFTRLGRFHRLPWNGAMYVLLLLVPAPAGVATVEALSGQDQVASVNVLLAVGVPIALLIGAAANTLVVDRQATLRGLRERIAEPVWDAHLGELHRRRVESDAASFLHNSVQSRLAAASLQLELASRQGDEARAADALHQARATLEMAAAAHSTPIGSPPRERLDELAVAWEGIAEVTIESPDVLEPESAWRMAVEAVEECVANAVRHGHASRVSVLCRQNATAIEIDVDDDGFGLTGAEGAGLGSVWMSQVTEGQWSRTGSGIGSRVALSIPIAAAAAVGSHDG